MKHSSGYGDSLSAELGDVSSIVATSRRKSPRQERAKATVEAILEASSQVLVGLGYTKMTTTRVAKRAGVSVGTLYQYFADKEELVRAVWARHEQTVFDAIGHAMQQSEGAALAERVETVLGAVLQAKASRAKLTTALSTTMTQLDGPAHLARIQANNEATVRAVLEVHADELIVEPSDQTVFLVVNAIEGVISAAITTRPEELADPALLAGLTRMILRFVTRQNDAGS